MLVKDVMIRHPVMVTPDTPATEAQQIMTETQTRYLPVVEDGKRLVGLVFPERFSLSPDILTSLNVWEITRRLSNLKVRDVMLKDKDVVTVTDDTTVERASQMLSDMDIRCLPVVEEGIVIGLITEAILLKSYQIMLGLPANGVRVTMRMPNRLGEFNKLVKVLAENSYGVMGVGTYPSPRNEGFYDVVIKVPNITIEIATEMLSRIPDQELIDIRDVV
jgi:acetoin utilization protein AcuB